jgi:hypothetical protein
MLYMFLLCFLVSLPTRLPPQDLSLLSWFHCLQGFNSRTCFCCQEHQFSGLTVSDTRSINSLALLFLIPGASTLWPYYYWYQENQLSGLTLALPVRLQLQGLTFSVHASHMQLISFHAFSQSLIITCYYTCNSSHLMLFHNLSSTHAITHATHLLACFFHNLLSTHSITHATHLISCLSQSFINTCYHTCNSSHINSHVLKHNFT